MAPRADGVYWEIVDMDYVAGLWAVALAVGAMGLLLLWASICARIENNLLGAVITVSPIFVSLFFVVSYAVGQQ